MSEVFEIKSKPKSKQKTDDDNGENEENNVGFGKRKRERLFSSYSGNWLCMVGKCLMVLHTRDELRHILEHMVVSMKKQKTNTHTYRAKLTNHSFIRTLARLVGRSLVRSFVSFLAALRFSLSFFFSLSSSLSHSVSP